MNAFISNKYPLFDFAEAVKKLFTSSTDVTVRSTIAKVLRYAPDRVGAGGRSTERQESSDTGSLTQQGSSAGQAEIHEMPSAKSKTASNKRKVVSSSEEDSNDDSNDDY